MAAGQLRRQATVIGIILVLVTGGALFGGSTAAGTDPPPCSFDVATPHPYWRDRWLSLEFLPIGSGGQVEFGANGRLYFHPVATIQRALVELAEGRVGVAESLAAQLVDHSTLDGDVRTFPYPFAYEWAGHTLSPGWVSAMAQGQAISLFILLYEATGHAAYLRLASESRNALVEIPGLVRRDGPNVWLQEYPTPGLDPIFNGDVFAIIGLYDYDRTNARASLLFCETLETLTAERAVWADPKTVWYDLLHTRPEDGPYVQIHRYLFGVLGDITGDTAWQRLAARP